MNRFWQTILLLTSGLFLIYTVSVGINAFFRYNRFQQEYRVKHAQYKDLKKRHATIVNNLNRLSTPEEWESLSRTKLKMIKKNEQVYLFFAQEAQ